VLCRVGSGTTHPSAHRVDGWVTEHAEERFYLMRAAVLHEHGAPPQCGEFAEPQASEGEVIVEVEMAGVNHLDLAKASGRFYTGPPPLPSVVGSDGVGRLPDGRRVFFDMVRAPYGSMAERTVVPTSALFDVAEGVDSSIAATLGNTGLAAWLALEWRAQLQPGESVLVLAATGAVGSAAVQIARALGAGRVIAAARPNERLARLGADAVVELVDGGDLATAFKDAAGDGIDVIIDPLWGPPALAAMSAARRGARHIQLGDMASDTITLPAPLVRSTALDIRGFAVFHPPAAVRHDAYLRLTRLAAEGGLTVDVQVIPLADVAEAWERKHRGPTVKLVIDCR
jgi:NADPH:quinone reductase-like Zn-dependent oxidoreductase